VESFQLTFDSPFLVVVRDWSRTPWEYVVNVSTGRIVDHRSRAKGLIQGVGKRQWGSPLVLVYKDEAPGGRHRLLLQQGSRRFEVSKGLCSAHLSSSVGGLIRQVRVRCGEGELRLRECAVGRRLVRWLDPAFDDFDESVEDFLGWLADLLTDEAAQAYFLQTWSGPVDRRVP
jgi:hypothetical protein